MIKRRDNDSYVGVASVSMAVFALTLLIATGASSILLILVIAGISGLAGLQLATMVVGIPVSTPKRVDSRFLR